MLGLVLDEPKESDQVQQIQGLEFLVDKELVRSLKSYLPVKVDFDDRFWSGLRVQVSRGGSCC